MAVHKSFGICKRSFINVWPPMRRPERASPFARLRRGMDKHESRSLKKREASETFRLPSSREGEAAPAEPRAPYERLGNERKANLKHVAEEGL